MTDPLERPDSVDIARTCLYQWLSLALSDPSASRARWLRLFEEEQRQRVALAAQVLPYSRATPPGGCAPGEVPPAQLDAGPLLSCSNRPSDVLEREYRHVFGLLVGKECPANETEYCPQTFSVYRAQRMADVAGFYRAFAVQPSSAMPERPDHISLEFEFMAWLIVKRRRARASGGPEGKANATTCFEAERTFFAEHLAWWVPAFARALRRTVGRRRAVDGDAGESESFLGAVATFLSAFIAAERATLDVQPPTEPWYRAIPRSPCQRPATRRETRVAVAVPQSQAVPGSLVSKIASCALRIDVPIRPVAAVTILDARALDTIARCLDRLTGMSGLNAAECLSALEEFSRPLTPAERVQILVWYDFRDYPVGQVH